MYLISASLTLRTNKLEKFTLRNMSKQKKLGEKMYNLEMQYVAIERFVPIAYNISGPPGEIPLLICHGLGAYHIQWEQDIKEFSKNRQVLTIDLRGHGYSAGVRNPTQEDYSIERMALDVIGVIEHCGFKQVDYLGNSLGGMIGLDAAQKRSDLIRSLITCGTAYKYKLSRLHVWLKKFMYESQGKNLATLIAKRATTNDELRPIVHEMYSNVDTNVMHLIDKEIYIFDRLDAAMNFKGPIIILRGETDKAINRELKRVMSILRKKNNFHVIELPKIGHFTNLDKPEVFRKAVWEALEIAAS